MKLLIVLLLVALISNKHLKIRQSVTLEHDEHVDNDEDVDENGDEHGDENGDEHGEGDENGDEDGEGDENGDEGDEDGEGDENGDEGDEDGEGDENGDGHGDGDRQYNWTLKTIYIFGDNVTISYRTGLSYNDGRQMNYTELTIEGGNVSFHGD